MLVRDNYQYQRKDQVRKLILEILTTLKEMMDQMDKFLLEEENETKKKILNKEDFINEHEKKIEKDILEIVSLEPMNTSEITWIFSMYRIIRELERVGDQIINVLEMSNIFEKHEIQPTISAFFKYEKEMTIKLYNGIENNNVNSLNGVINYDQYVNKLEEDAMNKTMYLIEEERNELTEGKFKIVMISRFLERIGDHLSNAAKAHKRAIEAE